MSGTIPFSFKYNYSLTFSTVQEVELSDIARYLLKTAEEFSFCILREGGKLVRYFIGSDTNLKNAIAQAAVVHGFKAENSGRFVIDLKNIQTTASVKISVNTLSDLRKSLVAAFLSINIGETIAAECSVRRVKTVFNSRRRTETAIVSFSIMFSGSANRLQELFPGIIEAKSWRITGKFEFRRLSRIIELKAVDACLPSGSDFKTAVEQTHSGRHFLPFSEDGFDLTGVRLESGDVFRIPKRASVGNSIVFGATGTGKTTLLARIAASCITEGRSVCIIDPHGDLCVKTVSLLNGKEREKIVYVDAEKAPAGLNPLSAIRNSRNRGRTASLIADSIGHTMRRSFGDEYWGPRLDYLMSGILMGLAEIDGSNFVDALEVISSPESALELSRRVTDPATRNFLRNEMPGINYDWWMSLKDKFGKLILNESARTILCRRHGNLDLDSIFGRSDSIAFNFDITRIGRGISSLLCSIVLSLFWIEASSRGAQLTIIVDEFQNLPWDILQEVASQGRKFGINIIAATQSPTSSHGDLTEGAMTNFESLYTLRLGTSDANFVSRLSVEFTAEEISALPYYHALFRCSDGAASITVNEIYGNMAAVESACARTAVSYPRTDDSHPSPLLAAVPQLYESLQIVDSAENRNYETLETLMKSGILDFHNIGTDEFKQTLLKARGINLVRRDALKLTEEGRHELSRLQGMANAGKKKHRDAVISVKAALDRIGLLTRMPRQAGNLGQCDLIAVCRERNDLKFFVEIEVSIKKSRSYTYSKVERALKNKAVPVLVYFSENSARNSFLDVGKMGALCLLLSGGELFIQKEGGLAPLLSVDDMTDAANKMADS
jgi:hypothetical protein